jgi:hypothetical protein
MIRMQGEIVINRPVDLVFDLVADARNEPHYNPRALRAAKISSGPIGLGTLFRTETTGIGRNTIWDIEITEYQRPRKLQLEIHSTATDIQGTQTFYPVDGGTRMRWSWDMKARGVFRLITPLIRRMGQRLEERNWQNLKRFLESKEMPHKQD